MRQQDVITGKTIIELLKRSKGVCEGCGGRGGNHPHHIFFKSQYHSGDRNLSWNLADLCNDCHRIMHHASTDKEILRKRRLDFQLKKEALVRYHGGDSNLAKLQYEFNKVKFKNKNERENNSNRV